MSRVRFVPGGSRLPTLALAHLDANWLGERVVNRLRKLGRAEDWPEWRGPTGMGVATDGNLPLTWSDKENVRWRVALPERGNSTPIVCGDRVFVTQAIEKEQRRTAMCFSKSDGKPLWQSGVTFTPAEPTNSQNPYCAASPVTDGQRVIAFFGSAGLYCYDLQGKELWHRDLGPVDSWHGSGSSPVLYHDLCILNFGPGSNSALVACNKRTGDVVWKLAPPKTKMPLGTSIAVLAMRAMNATGKGTEPPAEAASKAFEHFSDAAMAGDFSGAGGYMGSWSTPLIVRVGDHDELIVAQALAVSAYEPESGKQIWTCQGMTPQVFTSPVVADGIVVASGHGTTGGGTHIMAVKLGGSGDVTVSHRLWQVHLPKECVGSAVIVEGRVYLVTDHGFAVCLELSTGNKLWEQRLPRSAAKSGSWSSLVCAGEKIFIPNQSGEVIVLKASPDFDVLATNSIGDETTCASLAIADGKIFLRTYQALWCFGKPADEAARLLPK